MDNCLVGLKSASAGGRHLSLLREANTLLPQFDPENEWHSAVNFWLTVDCGKCNNHFASPTLGDSVFIGDEAAIVAEEAQAAGWVLVDRFDFRCPNCAAQDVSEEENRTGPTQSPPGKE